MCQTAKIDYLYVTGMHGDPLVATLHRFFSKHNFTFHVLTENYADANDWKTAGIPCTWIYDYSRRIVTKHGPEIIREIIDTEKSYYNLPKFVLRSKAQKILGSVYNFFETQIVCNVIQRPGGEILRRAVFREADDRSIRTFVFGENYLSGHMCFYTGEMKVFHKNELNLPITEVDSLISKRFASSTPVRYSMDIDPDEVISSPRIRKLQLLIRKKQGDIILSYIKMRYINRLTGLIRRLLLDKLCTNVDLEHNELIFFPLNVTAESELYVRNKKFVDQFKTVLLIQKFKPKRYTLIIKPHPGTSKSISLIEAIICRLHGIKIAKSSVSTKTLLVQSRGVIIVSSTVGLEAIYADVPLCILGKWAYSAFIGTPSKLNTVHEKLTEFFENPSNYIVNKRKFSGGLASVYFHGNVYSNSSDILRAANSIIKLTRK